MEMRAMRALKKAGDEEMAEPANGMDAETNQPQDSARRRLDVERIRELHARGKTPTEIAHELGCSRGGVSGVLRQVQKTNGAARDARLSVAETASDGSAPQASTSGANGHAETQLAELVELDATFDQYWQQIPRREKLSFFLQRSFKLQPKGENTSPSQSTAWSGDSATDQLDRRVW